MTSFSVYASKFLSSGAATASLQQPFAPQSSAYRPFGSSAYPHELTEEDDGVESEADAFGDLDRRRSSRPGRHHLPHLNDKTVRPSRPHTSQPPSRTFESIDDIDDEEEGSVHAYRDQRSNVRLPSSSSLLDEGRQCRSAITTGRDEHDPFLAEVDIQSGRARSKATSSSPAQGLRMPGADAKARGWIAHVADSSSQVSSAPATRSSRRQELPDDIYRDPDDEEEDEGTRQAAASALAGNRNGKRPARDRYSVYDDVDSSAVSTSTASSDESDSQGDSRHNRRRGKDESGRKAQISKAAGSIGSSLREPLLSSIGSEGGDKPPGAYKGTAQRFAAADVYAYPHPPAKVSWTPWAPGNRVAWNEYKDKTALMLWFSLVSGILLLATWMILGAETTGAPSSPSTQPSPYYTLTRSIPILFLLTFLSISAAAANLFVLRNINRLGGGHLLRSALVGIPIVLSIGWLWAFAGSFIYDDERWSGGSWSTTGLRILSLLPLIAAVLFARGFWRRRSSLRRSLSVLELSAGIIASHPALFALSLGLLLIFLAVTAPFLFVFIRLFLLGHFGRLNDSQSGKIWQTDSTARVMAWLTLGAWLWTWSVLRGIQRVTVAGVVSHWYFHRSDDESEVEDAADKLYNVDNTDDPMPAGPALNTWLEDEHVGNRGPSQVDIVRASFVRATGPALGTVCISALMLALARLGSIMASSTRWLNQKLSAQKRFPTILQPMAHLAAVLAGFSSLLQGFSDFALIYVGVTGDSFSTAARRSTRLVSRHTVKTIMEGLIINLLLDLTTLAFCFLTGLAGFLFSAHNLHVPADAPLVGLLCALLPYWTLRLCADVLSNAADTLYLCFSIDEASGEQHCPKAAEAFTGPDGTLSF